VWGKLSLRVERILSRVDTTDDFPTKTTNVERMLGYDFKRKLLLVEALTHASYQFDNRTVSYERMEFLGDSGASWMLLMVQSIQIYRCCSYSVLDMVVTNYLYHAPGKEYSPGHMHLRKSAVVNTHFLAYICLRCSLSVDTSMPRPNGNGGVSVQSDTQVVYLWQCLLHSSPRILDDFKNTFPRFQKSREEIEGALTQEGIFPWAALTRLQAPKLFSDIVESLLGAIYLDSNGNLDVIRRVLRKLGILPILERIVEDDVDILHPVSRLSVWASRNSTEIEYKFEKCKDTITCVILLNGNEKYWVTDTYRGHASQNDVKFAAAEQAIKALHLRELDERGQIVDEE
jgi:dsRNA-specific ribonuclease